MVPYNHSIHEIFQAAKVMGINTNYSIKKNDLDNLNEFLTKSDLQPITLSKAATIQVPQDRPKFTKEYSKGGRRKKTKRNKKKLKTKRSRLNRRKTRKH